MRLVLLAVLLAAPVLLAHAAIDVSSSAFTAGTQCAGSAPTVTTITSDACQDAGANSFKITCSDTRSGQWTMQEFTGTGCPNTATNTYTGDNAESCVSATVLAADYKVDCLVPCDADNDCNSHGTCNVGTGICSCTDSYTGDWCATAPTTGTCTDSSVCGEHGACNTEQTACECTDGYTGDLCATAPTATCPTASDQCGAHGACNTEQTACECTDGYTGDTCLTAPACATCDDNGHGACNGAFDACECVGGYTGSTDFKCDVAPECATTCAAAGHGGCNVDGDGCECNDGYTGDLCDTAPAVGDCPTGSNQCGEHGACNTATTACECTDGYFGNTCSRPPAGASCSDDACINGNCDAGACVCNDGWAGNNCDAQAADMAVISYFSDGECTVGANLGSTDISLDTCTKFPDNERSASVLCPGGVNGNFKLRVYSTATTCTGAMDELLGDDHTDCQNLGEGLGSVAVRCTTSGAMAVQASIFLVAALAIASKMMQW